MSLRKEAIQFLTSHDPYTGTVELLALAIEAERERCAQIALAIDSNRGNEKEIAAAIRRGPTQPPQQAQGDPK